MNSFIWNENSCYIDSVLWVLFRSSPSFIQKHFLQSSSMDILQTLTGGERVDLEERFAMELKSYFLSLRPLFKKPLDYHFTSDEFRSIFQKWYENPLCSNLRKWPAFHSSETNESQEFLQFLFSLKGMNGINSYDMVVSETIYYGPPWKKIKKRFDTKASLIWNLPIGKTEHNIMIRTEILEVPHTYKNNSYTEMKSVLEIQTLGDLLVISVERLLDEEDVSNEPCNIPLEIKDKGGKVLHLFGVIVFFGQNDGHYTAFLKTKKNTWVYYDDRNLPCKPFPTPPIEIFKNYGVLFFFS